MMVLMSPTKFSSISFSAIIFVSKHTKHGQSLHVSWQKHGSFVRVFHQSFNRLFKQSLTVLNNGRAYLVSINTLRSITCSRCNKAKFYVKIQTKIEAEFLSIMSEKFVCPKCKRAKE